MFLFERFHKKHHEYTSPFPLASEYASITEYVVGNLIPSNLVFVLLLNRTHLFTYLGWIIYRLMLTFEAHSGIE